MYNLLNNILYHIEGFTDFCFASPVYALLFLNLKLAVVAYVMEVLGLIYQKRQNRE